jgi:hypothetical protein
MPAKWPTSCEFDCAIAHQAYSPSSIDDAGQLALGFLGQIFRTVCGPGLKIGLSVK